MVQLTAFITLLAATESDHLLGNDGFGSDVRVSREKAARGELEGATAARSRGACSDGSANLKLTEELTEELQAAKRQPEKTRRLRRGAPVERLCSS